VRLGRWGLRFFTLVARAQGSPEGLAATLRQAIYSVDPSIPVSLSSMNQVIERRYGHYQVYGRFYLAFGGLALFMAILGLYGVLSYSVNRQKTEIGIKMALGASSRRILGSVMKRGLGRIGAGILLGAGIAFWISRGLEGILFRVDLADPLVWSAILSLTLLAGLSACWIPARRAARIDPIRAIRQ
jgi:ABC-type antimicrobial peptide transport system permease subunit